NEPARLQTLTERLQISVTGKLQTALHRLNDRWITVRKRLRLEWVHSVLCGVLPYVHLMKEVHEAELERLRFTHGTKRHPTDYRLPNRRPIIEQTLQSWVHLGMH